MARTPFPGSLLGRTKSPGIASAGWLRSYPWRRLLIGLAVVFLAGILAAALGSVRIPPLTTLSIVLSRLPGLEIGSTWPQSWETILWDLRLPRIALAGIVGGALAVSGATYQGLFRNPLADPYLIGVASGAGLGATVVLVTGVPREFFGISLLPVAAFGTGLVAVSAAYLVARHSRGLALPTLILAGVAIASFCGAMISLLMIRSDPDIRPLLSWLLGGFVSAQWRHSLLILPYLLPSVLVVLAYGRILNVIQLDDQQATQLGVNVERTKIVLIVAASLATAAAVSFSGLIGFVGLIAPHAVRLVWGMDYRTLLPMSAIVGAAFLILADMVARTVASPAELPVGIITAFCGAPFFLYLLRKRGRLGG